MPAEFNLTEYMKLQKFDEIKVTMDFTPSDGIDNIMTVSGIFVKHADNIPAGWIPLAYVVLDNGIFGWIMPYRIVGTKKISVIELVRAYSPQVGDKETLRRVVGVIDSVQVNIGNMADLLQSLENDLRKMI